MKQTVLVWVIYDGIHNSVFESQVLQPLLKYKQQEPNRRIILISFENKEVTIPTLPIELHLLKKLPFLGMWSLYPAIYTLHKLLKQLPSYDLIARGPLAGYICKQSANGTDCKHITIQARGLLAAEYRYVHTSSRFPMNSVHAVRAKLYDALERNAYTYQPNNISCSNEIVSKALLNHLVQEYALEGCDLTIAQHDVPEIVPEKQRLAWRKIVRHALHIKDQSTVYCYNGSAKAWQCVEEAVNYFVQEYQKNPDAFLLVLTQDKDFFASLVRRYAIPTHAYKIINVSAAALYHYLAACDIGIVLRRKHILNWISRPTKVLDYQAVGLIIAHNNTIEMLSEYPKSRIVSL